MPIHLRTGYCALHVSSPVDGVASHFVDVDQFSWLYREARVATR